MLASYEEAWEELKNRLENFLWALEHRSADEQRIKDTKGILDKMEYLEQQILDTKSLNLMTREMEK